eukprot:GFUD01008047.1.p1 GENE.GFUD01008047.1~~GFUD01008047.1.p1  ORF type:complete len:659 (+),score=176.58 GFUD01008047.1:50-2026(+)
MGETKQKKEESLEAGEAARVTWDSPVQFFFTVLGFCVGLGNIWRFPYLCQQNGGGAFIIPFLIMLIVVGMPLLLLELALGQKLRVGAAEAWKKVHPALAGVGYGSTIVATIVGCYYNVIIAWCIFYLGSSFTTTLPWSSCPLTDDNQTIAECEDSSETQYFWFRTTLDASGSIDDPIGIKYWTFLCLVLSWVIVYLILMKGIASSGKVVYFTAMFPYVVLTIFFFRGITLKGATAGLSHMFTPKLEMLLKPTVWLDAANQVFYSFGLAFGSIISFGSYNNPKKNCVKDVIIISFTNAFTAIYACAVIFSILGFKAVHLFEKCLEHDVGILMPMYPEFKNRNMEDIPQDEYSLAMSGFTKIHPQNLLKNCSLVKELDDSAQGTGFAFIVMADVFTKIPGAPFWSALFFMMLLSLGLGSQIGIMEGVMSTLFDQPSLKHIKKPVLVGCVAVGCFSIGLVFTTGAGEYWLTLFDSFGATGLTFIAFAELLSVMYVYGHERFTNDIETMTGVRPGLYWQLMWRFVSPTLMAAVIASSTYFMLTNKPVYTAWNRNTAAGEKKEYAGWSLGVAALLAMSSLIPILVGLVVHLVKRCNRRDNKHAYEAGKFYRVDTTASTRPMLGDNYEDFPDLPLGDEDSDSDSGTGIVMEGEAGKPFKLEVMD